MDSPNHLDQEVPPTTATGKEKITAANVSAAGSSTQAKVDTPKPVELYLVGALVLRERGDEIIKELKCVEPYTLSTNEKQFDNMTTSDLHESFMDLWETYYHQRTLVSDEERMSVGFKNWLIIDLCRRCKVLHDRFQASNKQSPLSYAQNGEPLSFDAWLHKPSHGRKYFNKNRFLSSPILSNEIRSHVLGISHTFGDAIIACTEFIDMDQVTTMTNHQFQSLWQALKKHQATIEKALQVGALQPLLEEASNNKVMGKFKAATRLA